jgi:hypothetical protein
MVGLGMVGGVLISRQRAPICALCASSDISEACERDWKNAAVEKSQGFSTGFSTVFPSSVEFEMELLNGGFFTEAVSPHGAVWICLYVNKRCEQSNLSDFLMGVSSQTFET